MDEAEWILGRDGVGPRSGWLQQPVWTRYLPPAQRHQQGAAGNHTCTTKVKAVSDYWEYGSVGKYWASLEVMCPLYKSILAIFFT